MRNYPHKPDAEDIREIRERCLESYKDDILKIPIFLEKRRWVFFRENATDEMELGNFCYAFEEPVKDVIEYLRKSCSSLSIAIDFGMPMDPGKFLEYISRAVVVQDKVLVEQLSGFDRKRYTYPDVKYPYPEVRYLIAEIYADLAGDRHASATERVPKAISELSSRSVNRIQKMVIQELIMAAKAIIEKNQEDFDKAMEARCKDWAKLWPRSLGYTVIEALIDMPCLGILRLAMNNGLKCNIQSVYLPLELLKED
ncbi:MAG: Imm49 family immunity protein [Candidatus Desantisbacteria bacterium]